MVHSMLNKEEKLENGHDLIMKRVKDMGEAKALQIQVNIIDID